MNMTLTSFRSGLFTVPLIKVKSEWNFALATNSDFLIFLSLHSNFIFQTMKTVKSTLVGPMNDRRFKNEKSVTENILSQHRAW